jgi:hypothetical protein
MANAVVEAGPEAAILWAAESRLQLLPLVRAMGHGVGQQVRIPTPGTHGTRALFGALDLRTGRWGSLVRERRRTDAFLAFLEPRLAVYPQDPMLLMVDHFSRHTAPAVGHWLTAHPRVQWYYLPKYCAPLNPVERIGLRRKNPWAANRWDGAMRL